MTEQEAKTLAAELAGNRIWNVLEIFQWYDWRHLGYGVKLQLREDPRIDTILLEPPDAEFVLKLQQRRAWLIDIWSDHDVSHSTE